MQDEDFTDDTYISKTKRKEAMHELRDLGAELVELSVGQLKRINLPEDILAAVRECQKITAHGARRRQIQYLGKLMRGVDDAPIRAGLAMLRGESAHETARLHRIERLRERLLADETVLRGRSGSEYPDATRGRRRQGCSDRRLCGRVAEKPAVGKQVIHSDTRSTKKAGTSPPFSLGV